jgi:hypothetical protein
MTPANPREIIDGLVQRCTIDLLSAYDVSATPAPLATAPPDFAFGAVLGFTGESVRGSLVLAMTADTIRRSVPEPTGGGPLREWIAELCNQLLGRIKNQLLAYGVEIYVTIPVVIRGRLLASESGPELLPHRFVADDNDVFVWFDYETVAGLQLERIEERGAHPEGSSFFF